jgi:hypothetical protein
VGTTPDRSPDVTAAGRAYLDTLDLDTLDLGALLTPDASSRADCSEQSVALGQVVIDKVTTHLRNAGYDTSQLGFGIGAHWDPKP